MSSQPQTLQQYDAELSSCLEEFYHQRDELEKSIQKEEEERNKINFDIRVLTERLARLSDSLTKKKASKAEFDKTIAETETAYAKILESSKMLVSVLKRESTELLAKKSEAQ
ncbi:putative nuclear autoantigen fo 14 kDa [Monocercomonoides exilis]|uniref:putative nuclear autoantigen fo 14 kDa n=1 Tax=Monocercomonoides exilis TaxID=2049356 RepID=UPI003559720E|nr:putative nuclear autoantigen fo 14 kDa [Monocercomonoides exilis]